MSLPRQQLREDTLLMADAFGSRRWDAEAGGEVDRKSSGVYDKIWRRILNANQHYRVSQRTPTADATGRYLVSDLDSTPDPDVPGSIDTLERFYRVLAVKIDGLMYTEDRLSRWVGREDVLSPLVWYREGTRLTVIPLQAAKVADGIWVNWIPQRPSALAGDASTVEFPDGYEEVLVTMCAARLLMKGGAETEGARELRMEVQEDYDEMLQDIARVSTKPMSMIHSDDESLWGSE